MDGPLSEVLRAAAAVSGSSYGKLAELAIDPETGEQLTKANVYRIASGRQVTAPPAAELRAIAACLGEDADTIKQLAAAQWLDYHVHDEPREGGFKLWARVRQLSEEDQQTVQDTLQTLVERLSQSRRGDRSRPGE